MRGRYDQHAAVVRLLPKPWLQLYGRKICSFVRNKHHHEIQLGRADIILIILSGEFIDVLPHGCHMRAPGYIAICRRVCIGPVDVCRQRHLAVYDYAVVRRKTHHHVRRNWRPLSSVVECCNVNSRPSQNPALVRSDSRIISPHSPCTLLLPRNACDNSLASRPIVSFSRRNSSIFSLRANRSWASRLYFPLRSG